MWRTRRNMKYNKEQKEYKKRRSKDLKLKKENKKYKEERIRYKVKKEDGVALFIADPALPNSHYAQ